MFSSILSLNTRSRAVIVVILTTIAYVFFRSSNLFFTSRNSEVITILFDAVIVSLVTLIGTAWIINFKIGRKQVLNLLMLPWIFTFILTIFSRLSLLSTLFSLKGGIFMSFLTLFLALGLYFLLLNINILNVATIMNIPLERAAKSVNYIFSIIIFFLLLVTILSLDIVSYFKIISIAFLIFLLASQSINLVPKIAPTRAFQLSLLVTTILIIVLISMMFFNVEPQFPALLLTSLYYMIVGVIYENGHKLTLLTIFEYSSTILILILVFLIFSDFGIYKLI